MATIDDIEDIITQDSHTSDPCSGNRKHVVPRARKVKITGNERDKDIYADSLIPGRLTALVICNHATVHTLYSIRVKPVLSGHSKEDQNLVFKSDYCLMQVKSIAECSPLEHSAIFLTCIK